MNINLLDDLLNRMIRSKVAALSDLVGCNEVEIAALESKFQVLLPLSYKAYLELMGHESGRLFTCDHAAAFYSNVVTITTNLQDGLSDFEAPITFSLPQGAVLINCRLDDQFEFIICDDAVDSSVYYFNTWDWHIIKSHNSVVDWLESWCALAEHAISSGYFEKYPNGTSP